MDDLICYCFSVSEKRMRESVRKGAKTVSDISRETNACMGCRICMPDIEAVIKSELRKIGNTSIDMEKQ